MVLTLLHAERRYLPTIYDANVHAECMKTVTV